MRIQERCSEISGLQEFLELGASFVGYLKIGALGNFVHDHTRLKIITCVDHRPDNRVQTVERFAKRQTIVYSTHQIC